MVVVVVVSAVFMQCQGPYRCGGGYGWISSVFSPEECVASVRLEPRLGTVTTDTSSIVLHDHTPTRYNAAVTPTPACPCMSCAFRCQTFPRTFSTPNRHTDTLIPRRPIYQRPGTEQKEDKETQAAGQGVTGKRLLTGSPVCDRQYSFMVRCARLRNLTPPT